MLLQVSVENFKSIQKQIVFSMVATKEELHESFVRQQNGYHVLPSSIILGTNGAGKSNLFLAIKYIQELLIKDKAGLNVFPHLLSEKKKPTQIDIQFVLDDVRVVYGIDISSNQVVSEFLYTFEGDKQFIIYEREFEEYHFNSSYETMFNDVYKNYGSKEKLFLSLLNNYTEIELIHRIYQFLTENIVVLLSDITDDNELFLKSIEEFKIIETQNFINELMKKIDIGILGFELIDDRIMVKYENLNINLFDESTGTKKLFSLLILLCDALKYGKVIFFDELEKHLHYTLVQYIIYLFNDKEINYQNAQLIFSTHQSSLLNLAYFRRDQIWFIEKNLKQMTTECYSLYDIEGVKSHEDIQKGYILGKYGATYQFKYGGVKKDEK